MKCSRCGSLLSSGTLFCDTCGAPQARVSGERTKEGQPFQMGEPVKLTPPAYVEPPFAGQGQLSLLALLTLFIGLFSAGTLTCLGFVFLVLGPFVGVPPAMVGIISGHVALSRIRSSEGRLTGASVAVVGLVLSYLTLFAGLGVTAVWLVIGKLVLG